MVARKARRPFSDGKGGVGEGLGKVWGELEGGKGCSFYIKNKLIQRFKDNLKNE